MIKKDTIDKIFEVSRVEEVIGEFVSLKKVPGETVNILLDWLRSVLILDHES